MEMQQSDIGDVRKIVLVGRLDTAGVDRVETRFGASVVASGRNTVVDLSQVTFLASMGIRMLIATARSMASRKRAKIAMYGANSDVMEIIDTTALHDIIPYAGTEAEAIAIVTA
jgi:anti-anti-sigma factor